VAAETIALHTIFALMRSTKARVHLCRISSAEGVELVHAAKKEGLAVTADVSINSLHLSDHDIGYFDSRARVTPVLRHQRDRDALRAALADGVPRTIRISPSTEGTEQLLGDVLAFGMTCHSGGTLELFIDPVLPLTELTVMGDSPVAHALCELAPRVGFSVRAVPSAFDQVPSGGWVIVATQGRGDLPALRAALDAQSRTVWFVAS
jgi:xanthine/CO dehydrogenase XdhC/CoxF family maturation factor